MKNRLSRLELLAVLTAAGVASCATAALADTEKSVKHPSLKVADKTAAPSKGKDSACGEGACGTDEKGAQAAKDRDKKKAAQKPASKPKAEAKAKPAAGKTK